MVDTHSLTKRYGNLAALSGCTLNIQRGEIFGLLGPNGSGKTTLIRLLMGYLRPTSGRAMIDGLDCYRDSVAVHVRASYLPGDARLFRQMRGNEVLRFFANVRPGGDLSRSLALAERLSLDVSRQVATYSTGMRQKLALIATMAADTSLVILDEPTSSLDPTIRQEVVRLVREAQAAGRTILLSSHVLSEVEQACDRVAILRRGELVHTQVVSELRRQHSIQAKLSGKLPPLPAELGSDLDIHCTETGDLVITTPAELLPLLGWLATLPLTELHIQPVGLQAIYDRYHGQQAA